VGSKASVAVGFQLRHATPYVQVVERVRRGDIGSVVCGLIHYYAGAIPQPARPGAAPERAGCGTGCMIA
jgi:predicted dehydrogenase